MNTAHSSSMISSSCTSELTDEKLKGRQTLVSRHCPSCGHSLDCNPNMIGLPAGVKFDPSDQELLEHLESLVNEGGSRAHPLIDDFISTIQGEDGICYTHPEKLPGVTRDGLSKHFFHRQSKAYTTGTRKRRKINSEQGLHGSEDVGEARWHKTGKTRPVIVDGQQKGCKKILVLYTYKGKQGKPEKTNWVMHQYNLGDQEEEKDGELIVSKVFYQTQLRSAMATIEKRTRNGAKVADSSEAMHNVLPGCAAGATAVTVAMMPQRQQKRQKQADDHCSFAPAKMTYEVGVGDQVTGVQGEERDNHHRPSQHHVQSDLHVKPVTTMSFHVGTPLDTVSTAVSPTVQRASVLVDSRFFCPAILRQNEKDQAQQQKVGLRSAEMEGLITACQSASTEAGSSTQSKEIQQPYHQYRPPDHNQDQHELQCS